MTVLPFLRDALPLVAGAIVVVMLIVLVLLLRSRNARARASALAREERALEALSLLRDSRLVPPPMDQAVEVFDVEALLGADHRGDKPAAVPAAPAPVAIAVPVPGFNEPPDTLGAFGASTEQPLGLGAAIEVTEHAENNENSDNTGQPEQAEDALPETSAVGARGLGADVPLRDLVLVWFESRGYQPSPASAALMPIEYVLRHRADPARAYAFVALTEQPTLELGTRLIEQARMIGLERLLVTTERSAERAVRRALRKQGLRLMDRAAMDDTLAKLEFRIAAKIVTVAQARDQARTLKA